MKTYTNFSDFFDNIINGKWIIPNEIFSSITSCCNIEREFKISELCKDSYYKNWNSAIKANNIESIDVILFDEIGGVDSIKVKNKIAKGDSIICVKVKNVLKIYIQKDKLKCDKFEHYLNVAVCKTLHGKFESTDRVCIEYYENNKFSFTDFFNMLMKVCEQLNKKVKKIKVENRDVVFKEYKDRIVNEPISNKDNALAFCQVTYRFVMKSDTNTMFKNYEIGKLFDAFVSMNKLAGMFNGILNGKTPDANGFDFSSIGTMMNMFRNINVDSMQTNLGANSNIDISNLMNTFMKNNVK